MGVDGEWHANLKVEGRANGTVDVSDGLGHWITFTLSDLRDGLAKPRVDMIFGSPTLGPNDALEFITVAHAMAQTFAYDKGLISRG